MYNGQLKRLSAGAGRWRRDELPVSKCIGLNERMLFSGPSSLTRTLLSPSEPSTKAHFPACAVISPATWLAPALQRRSQQGGGPCTFNV